MVGFGRHASEALAGPVRAVLLDSGDTLVDEGTQVIDGDGVIVRGDLLPGAAELVAALADRYPLGLVADGPRSTFDNVLGIQHGLLGHFEALAISGEVGVTKPDQRMFAAALDALEIEPADRRRVVMVGNNLARDIAGANALGLISVWIDWSPRYPRYPRDPESGQEPAHRITEPLGLLAVLDALERGGRT